MMPPQADEKNKNSLKMARERTQPIYEKGRASIILFVLKGRPWSRALQRLAEKKTVDTDADADLL